MPNTPHPIRLTDVQTQILIAALLRPDGAVALQDQLKGNVIGKVGQALLDKGLVREIRAKPDLPVWRREADTGRSFSLVLTKAGRASVAGNARAVGPKTEPVRQRPKVVAPPPVAVQEAVSGFLSTPRSGSKLAEVIALLRRDQGTNIAELMAITGWLPHTTRAALTGLRKRGYGVTREIATEGSVYRIVEVAAAAA